MSYDLVIKEGRVVTADTSYVADVAVQDQRIAAIGANLSGKQEIDAGGMLVTPGAVDVHVHMEMPIGQFTSCDDFFTGTRAAAFGGTTCIIDFVESLPEQTMMEGLAERRAAADPRVTIDYGLHMTIGPDEMNKLDELPHVYEAGCASFKLYMAYGFCLTDDQMMRALEAVRDVNGWPVVHAENWAIIQALIARNLAAGNTEARWHPRSRPAIMEGEAVGRVIDIATLVGTRLHIFHISCDEAAQRVAAARRRGLPVTGETCPHFLLLTQELYDRPGVEGALPVCAPPIRYADSQQALWRALGNGDLQVVATDHCPFTRADKETGLHDFSCIPGGVPSVEIRFPALYSEGVRRERITLNQWIDLCCTSPARLAGLQKKGEIAVGYDADLVVFDPQKEVTINSDTLHENVDWTLYQDKTIQGWPTVTISRGDVIVQDGQFKAQPGRGRFVKRRYN
ncbi:MAG TPA: dihydropyrimidinase [Candidatus Sulfomarinibacteraceae bacterium]|nr:dihydropyrimidinase [Candidatus Sulfomarinibacteraceae bacterium]